MRGDDPTPMSTDRYADRPFVRLLECYILDAIGELAPAQQETLQRMEPKLVALYGTPGPWPAVVAAQMEFPPSLPAQLRALWAENQALAAARGEVASAPAFAAAFVDAHFPDVAG